ncbi:MAG: flagellar biosynthesis protein FliQ [Pirellulales bacterium]|nr:flagellar biosynthesis protein FliQ [Pirellulales bacterium]
MSPQDVVDLVREALQISLLVSAPVLVTGLVVGLGIGLLQALTQVQEQTVSFIPKLIAMAVVCVLALPWVIGRMQEYVHDLISDIPNLL